MTQAASAAAKCRLTKHTAIMDKDEVRRGRESEQKENKLQGCDQVQDQVKNMYLFPMVLTSDQALPPLLYQYIPTDCKPSLLGQGIANECKPPLLSQVEYDFYENRNAQMREEYNRYLIQQETSYNGRQFERERHRRQDRPVMDFDHTGAQIPFDRDDERFEHGDYEGGKPRSRRGDDRPERDERFEMERRTPRGFRGNRSIDSSRRYNRDRKPPTPRGPSDIGRYERPYRERDPERDDRERRSDGYRSREDSPRSSRNGRGSRSTSRERSRDRADSRDRRNSRDRKLKPNSRSRVQDDNSADSSDFYDHWSYNSHLDSKAEDYRTQTASNTVIIRGLAQHIAETDIKEDIIKCGLMPKDIRLIRRKDTGASRGFAFVEFNTKQEASRWIETKQGELILHDQYRAVIHYSVSAKCTNDWVCTKCGGHNFRRRDTCYKCYTSRLESRDEAEERDEVSRLPTHTILLRNLDVLTTEETVLLTMKSLPALTMTHVKSIRIGRDPLTNTSLGLCYIEMKSLIHATHFHHVLTAHRLEIDGKKVLVSYCKVNDGSSQVSGANAGYASVTNYTAKDIPRLAEYSASLYATTTEEHATYLQYYTDYYQNQVAQGGTISLPTQTQTDTVNAAAAAPATSTSELASAYYTGNATVSTSPAVIAASAVPASSSSTTPSHSTTLTQYPTPDVSTYQYDKTSGYYYDPQTGLYYDASSQYYYNSQTQQFMYWDADKHTYMPAPVSAAITAAPTTTPSTDTAVTAAPATPATPTPPQPEVTPEDGEKDEKKGKEKEKQDKVKVAKKVVKEMERWAKMLNQKKENAQQNLTMQAANLLQSKSKGTADIGYAVLERKESQPVILNNSVSTLPFTMQDSEQSVLASRINLDSASRRNVPSLVPKYGGGSDSEDNEDGQSDESQFTNWVKMACLLCKRQFPTKDALIRHQQLSDLHKENFTKWQLARGSRK
uniref:RNA-binding protein 5 n=1 Tax=Timema genevievae TaxID=629358 RepID=A0A7R9JMK0_TIMGE|nr:unnamed protein product [Timema genevievae]